MTNWQNRTLFHGDNLGFLRAMNSESVDLIATDPPFNKGRDFHATPDSLAVGAKFQDRWSFEKDVHQEWVDQIADDWPTVKEAYESALHAHSEGMGAFMCFMAVRLLEMHRLLKPTGSIYLHCDPTASHYLKAVMDAIFGWRNFRNEIVWQRAAGRAKGSQHKQRRLGQDVDYILHYAAGADCIHNPPAVLLSKAEREELFPQMDDRGRLYNTRVPLFRQPSMGARPKLCYTYKGVTNPHPSGWRVSLQRLKKMDANGEIIWREGKRPLRKSFADDYAGKPIGCLWTDIPNVTGSREHVGYPTQKPLPLYERIIKASSNEGDIVLDPFCGCATTLIAAERLKRQWVGMDIWDNAKDLVLKRLASEGLVGGGKDKTGLFDQEVHFLDTPPARTDGGDEAAPFLRVTERFKRPPLEAWQKLSRARIIEELTDAQSITDGLVLCAGCGRELEAEFMELDHITPRSDRGENDISNRILLCRPCNGRKSARLTLKGLLAENRKKKWMKDEKKAIHACDLARVRYEDIRYHRLALRRASLDEPQLELEAEKS